MAAPGLGRAGVATIASLAAAYVVASTCWFAWHGSHPLPYWDAWGFVDDFADWHAGSYSWHELIRPANEHRIALPRLLFFVDYLGFRASEKFLVVVALAMLCTLTVLVARLAVVRTRYSFATRTATAAFVAATLFSGTQISCLGWSFAVQFMAQSLLPAVACALLLRHAPRRRDVAIAIVCAVGATFSIASSLLLWPVLIAIAATRRLGSGAVAGVAVAGAACWLVYLGERAPLGHRGGGFLDVALPALAWSLTHLGGAWQFDTALSLAFGAGGGLLLVAALPRLASTDDPQTRTLVVIAGLWALYSLAIGYGRHDLGRAEALAGRYAPGPLLFWAALLAAHLRCAPRRSRRLLAIAAAVLVGALVYKQHKASKRWLTVKEARTVAALSFWLGDLDRARCAEIGARSDDLHDDLSARVDVLRRHRVSIFASPLADLPGTRLEARFRIDAAAVPDAAFTRLPDRTTDTDVLRQIAGTLPPSAAHLGSALAGLDAEGRVCALGSTGWEVARSQRTMAPQGAQRWFALVPANLDPTRLRWLALDVANLTAHPLPPLPAPP